MVKDMRLETKRLIIRPYVEDDLMGCFQLMQNKDLFTYMNMDVMPLEEYKGLFRWLIDSYQTGVDGDFKYSFNVILKETDAHIGWVGIGGVDFDHSVKEIFWLMGKEYWNHGYASEAASALLEYSFNIIGLKYQSVVEGRSVEHAYYNGELLFSLTRAEYQGIV